MASIWTLLGGLKNYMRTTYASLCNENMPEELPVGYDVKLYKEFVIKEINALVSTNRYGNLLRKDYVLLDKCSCTNINF